MDGREKLRVDPGASSPHTSIDRVVFLLYLLVYGGCYGQSCYIYMKILFLRTKEGKAKWDRLKSVCPIMTHIQEKMLVGERCGWGTDHFSLVNVTNYPHF